MKTKLLCPSPISGHILTDIYQALQVGNKPFYHLLRPFITYPNLLSLLQQIPHLHYLLLSITTVSPKAYSPHSQYIRLILGEDCQIDITHMPPTRKKQKNKTHAHSGRHFFRIEAFPLRSKTASEVTQCLIREIIP